MRYYVDASAAVKLVVDEAESLTLRAYLDDPIKRGEVYSAILLETELRRAVLREGLDQMLVTALLTRVSLVAIPRSIFTEAGLFHAPHLRSLDAIHVSMAVDVECDVLVTYDRRMVDAAQGRGLHTATPS